MRCDEPVSPRTQYYQGGRYRKGKKIITDRVMWDILCGEYRDLPMKWGA